MATNKKLDEHNVRVSNALMLPFKRRIASLAIRSDIWRDASWSLEDRSTARTSALGAIAEIDLQVSDLSDIKFPAETKAAKSLLEAERDKMNSSYAGMRTNLVAFVAELSAKAA